MAAAISKALCSSKIKAMQMVFELVVDYMAMQIHKR